MAEQNFESVIATLGHLERVWHTSSSSLTFPQYVSTDKEIRESSTAITKMLDDASIERSMRMDLYKIVERVSNQVIDIKEEDSRLLRKMMEDYKRSGMQLPDDKRERFKEIRKRLAVLSVDFSSTINEDTTSLVFTEEELDGCSQDYKDSLEKVQDTTTKYKVTMKYPDYFGLMRFAKSETVRQKMAFSYESRCLDNVDRLAEAIELRKEAAELLGYPDHASFILDEKMAKDPIKVNQFLESMTNRLKPLATKERDVLTKMKQEETKDSNAILQGWDYQYYTRALEQAYAVDENQIKQYFEFNSVTSKMLKIYENVLGLGFKEISKDKASIWHEDVRLIQVSEAESGSLVGYFYLDLFPRDGKYTHAACFPVQPGAQLSDNTNDRQLPVAVMVANFTKPTSNGPSLLKHDEVVTYFHELGHVMHHICSKTKWSRFHGTNVEGDFVEAPSQMLENWCWEKDSLTKLSEHYQKPGVYLPQDLIDALICSKLINVGHYYLRQIFFGRFDMIVHSISSQSSNDSQWTGEKLIKLWGDLRKSITQFSIQPGTFGGATFGHIMGGYDAGYYGYLWSLVISSDMYFTRFGKVGADQSSVGRDYRNTILAPGGSKDAVSMIQDFLGRESTQDAFLKSIGLIQ